jgi:GntR family transcriptional regulator / MocR family aminotransferase
MLDSRRSGRPLYRQIYEAIRTAILSGEFKPGKRLAATRALAKELGVSRTTVLNAYEQLFAEGYLDGKTGAGTFVAAELPDDLLKTEIVKQLRQKKTAAPLRLSPFGEKLAVKDVGSVRAQTIAKFQPFQNGLTAVD